MPEMIQHAVVTAVAVGAAWVLVQRLGELFRPRSNGPACSNCPSAKPASRRAPHSAADHPVVLHLHRPRKTT
jgi:hypothetical protein